MVKRFLDGQVLWWTGPGPMGMTLSSYALRHEGVTVWIDAVDPGRDMDEILTLGKPEHLLITFGDHDRDVNRLAKRFGAQVWVPEGQAPDFPSPEHMIHDGDVLPAGLKAMALPGVGYGETLLRAEVGGQKIGFIGDAFLHMPATGLKKLLLSLFLRTDRGILQTKRSFRGGDDALARRSLPKVLDLHLDAAFFSHGDPILSGAHQALADSLPC